MSSDWLTIAWLTSCIVAQHPNVADFWRAFEKPSGSYCFRAGRCTITFGSSVVRMAPFHYPSWRGMANLNELHYRQMCSRANILST